MVVKNKKKTKVFTSREDPAQKAIIGFAVFILLIFTLCSAYAIYLNPTNPAAWSMAVFFIFGFAMLVCFEDNVFPDLPTRKIPHALITWFFAWMFVALLISFLITMNMAHLAIAIMFGAIVFVGSTYVFSSEARWTNFKTTTKAKTGGAIKKKVKSTKTGKKVSKKLRQRKKKKKAKTKPRRIKGW